MHSRGRKRPPNKRKALPYSRRRELLGQKKSYKIVRIRNLYYLAYFSAPRVRKRFVR